MRLTEQDLITRGLRIRYSVIAKSYGTTLGFSKKRFATCPVHEDIEDCLRILQGASNADWSDDASYRKSATGSYYKLNDSGGAKTWNCKKQNTVDSSFEAEYQGLCAAVQ